MHVHYHRRCRPSGRRLQEALADLDADLVLNWGRQTGPDADYLNPLDAVFLAANKDRALGAFAIRGVPSPATAWELGAARLMIDRLPAAPGNIRMVGRTATHRGGSGVWLCATAVDVERSWRMGATHWLAWVDAVHEYRVHVVGGKVIKTSEKLGGDGVIRSKANGWVFRTPTTSFEDRKPVRKAARAAVKALGLDFGAADVLVDAEGNVYVTEVNTAPSLTCPTSTTFDLYVEAITALVADRKETP